MKRWHLQGNLRKSLYNQASSPTSRLAQAAAFMKPCVVGGSTRPWPTSCKAQSCLKIWSARRSPGTSAAPNRWTYDIYNIYICIHIYVCIYIDICVRNKKAKHISIYIYILYTYATKDPGTSAVRSTSSHFCAATWCSLMCSHASEVRVDQVATLAKKATVSETG